MATREEIEKRLITARVQMLINAPFFGNLACRLRLVDATKWLPTCATDGRHFYFNRDFVAGLSRPELTFVFCHEVLHCAYEHIARRKSRDATLHNYAADYVINLEIYDQKCGIPPKPVDKSDLKYNCLLDEKYRGLGSEQVYDLLKKMQEENPQGFKNQVGAGNFDSHASDLEDAEPDPTGENGPIPLTDDQKEQIKDEVRQAVLQAAKSVGAGNVPGGLKRMIQDLCEPKMDWREMLNLHIQSALKDDYTYMRPNRKAQGSGYILPGMKYAEKIKVDVAIDVSGSISDSMVKDFLSEVNGIMTQFDDFELRVWSFDTQVYDETMLVLTPDNIDDIHQYQMVGGGGTDFMCNWKFMEENEIEPDRFILFTDMYPCGSWGDPDYCDTLFVAHGTTSIIAPFGQTAWYEESD